MLFFVLFVFEFSKQNKNITPDLLTKKLFGSSGFKGREEEPENEQRGVETACVWAQGLQREGGGCSRKCGRSTYMQGQASRACRQEEWQEQCNPTSLLKSEFSIMQKEVWEDTLQLYRDN